MHRFRNAYRIPSARLPGFDYRSAGWYHVVFCTRDRTPVLGQVRDGIVGLSAAGCAVADEWQRTPAIRPYVRLDAWIVMPNHVHVLLGLLPEASAGDASSTLHARSVGAIVGQVKSVTTKRIRRLGLDDFAWQPRFWDRIIRSPRQRIATRRYIESNPRRWSDGRR